MTIWRFVIGFIVLREGVGGERGMGKGGRRRVEGGG